MHVRAYVCASVEREARSVRELEGSAAAAVLAGAGEEG